MKLTILVVTRLQDNGDGGYTMYVYNSEEELIADHPKSKDYREVDGEYKEVTIELSQEEKDYILQENDPYEDGYIGEDSIEIEVIDGVARLASELSFHAGQ